MDKYDVTKFQVSGPRGKLSIFPGPRALEEAQGNMRECEEV